MLFIEIVRVRLEKRNMGCGWVEEIVEICNVNLPSFLIDFKSPCSHHMLVISRKKKFFLFHVFGNQSVVLNQTHNHFFCPESQKKTHLRWSNRCVWAIIHTSILFSCTTKEMCGCGSRFCPWKNVWEVKIGQQMTRSNWSSGFGCIRPDLTRRGSLQYISRTVSAFLEGTFGALKWFSLPCSGIIEMIVERWGRVWCREKKGWWRLRTERVA